jgi:DNA (cytosine-5)-methyltransferase 1
VCRISLNCFKWVSLVSKYIQIRANDWQHLYSRSVLWCWRTDLCDFARLVLECQPEIVSMENVLQVKHHPVFHEFTKQLEKLDYLLEVHEVNCLDYGIPQSRKRLILLASKLGKINLIQPTHSTDKYNTVRNTIEKLEPLKAGQASKVDRLHQCSKLSPLNLERIRASKPGGTWRDWSTDLIAKCHKKETGKTYPAIYGRMEWDQPSPTITTQCFGFGNGRFGHPEQDRAISLRDFDTVGHLPRAFNHPKKGYVDALVMYKWLGT